MTTPPTLGELTTPFCALSNEIETLKAEVAQASNQSLLAQDARLVALAGIQRSLLSFVFWLSAGTNLKELVKAKGRNGWESEYRNYLSAGSGLFPGDPDPLTTIENLMVSYLKNALSVSIHFQIDNLFANLLRELGVTPSRVFGVNSAAILDAVDLPKNGTELDSLGALAYLRNSFHNNGIHRGADLLVVIGSQKYEFKKDQPVRCNSLPHLVTLLRANIDVIRRILKSPRASAIKHLVTDDFASNWGPMGPP